MKFTLAERAEGYVIEAYGDGQVLVNGVRYAHSIVIMPDRIIEQWRPQSLQTLESADFETLHTLNPDLVVLGTGTSQHFIAPALASPLIKRGIGLEVMNTPAACRTYNILMAEGRRVAAALLLG